MPQIDRKSILGLLEKEGFSGKTDENGNKLRSYRNFKKDSKQEKYTMMKNTALKKALAQFQCANHKLEIELHRTLDIPRYKIYCLICEQTEVGDELPYLLNCQALEMERKTALSKLSEFDQSFMSFNKIDAFIY